MFSSSTRFDSEPRTTILDYFVNKKKKIVRLFVLVSHQVALVGCHGFGRNFVFFSIERAQTLIYLVYVNLITNNWESHLSFFSKMV